MADLYGMAERAALFYAENPEVEAVLLGGSVSRGWQDRYSDIELLVFWKLPPSDEDRMKPIEKLEGTILDFHPHEDEEWSETYTAQGIKLEISNFLTATIRDFIYKTVQLFDTNPDTQCIAAAIRHGRALSGESVIAEMKQQLETYPDELRRAMIKANLDLGSRWHNREALLFRKDWLMLYKLLADVETKIMSLLFGLNRQYVIHPGFKWQRNSLASMPMKPENMSARMESVFLRNPQDAVRELETIVQELFDLIEKELPELDLTAARKQSQRTRPSHEGAGRD
ncbi:DUF4037 domain-containing protein [Planococcus sp. CAU13]|uniref:DUF4037 domain-containing protein n=1 Tax=Planococcus sp. CAU13 TaxID=1541197 RepID=UPI0009DE8807|nr:DUF4037 domain-containing protein [Planococcus sp. CAU13]